MDWRVAVPFAGLIGSITSAVGVNTSNPRSKVTANTTPSHVWKAEEVVSLEYSTKCQVESGSRRGDSYTFKWSATLDGGKSKDLLEGREATLSAEIELKADGDWRALRELTKWGDELVMGVFWGNKESKLKVYVSEKKKLGGKWIESDLDWHSKTEFTCEGAKLKNSSGSNVGVSGGKFVFNGEVVDWGNSRLVSEGKGIDISVNINRCDYDSSKKTTATCTLRLLTGTDLDWSTKVSATAKFTFSQ